MIDCLHPRTRVVDKSRAANWIRRRRECRECGYRFSTYEMLGRPALGRTTPAEGTLEPGDWVKINVRFDPETFAQISSIAKAERTTFSHQVRLLVEWGLEAVHE